MNISLKTKLVSLLIGSALPFGAIASDPSSGEVEPLTVLPAVEWTDAAPTTALETIVISAARACEASLVDKTETINNKVKPIKEVVGYIRSPQGLAVRLVNDHVVKIPAWVGYALDPVGSLKDKAVSEARDQVKSMIKRGSAPDNACGVDESPADQAETNTKVTA